MRWSWSWFDTFVLYCGVVTAFAVASAVIVAACCLIGYGIERAIVLAWEFKR